MSRLYTCIVYVYNFYVIDKILAADLYLIYKFEPKASVWISDKDRVRIFYISYETNAYICSYLSTIFKIRAVLAQKIERKVLNQDESLTNLLLIKFIFFNFLYELVRILLFCNFVNMHAPQLQGIQKWSRIISITFSKVFSKNLKVR